MPRRGRCRCGVLLIFQRTEQGYKMRCPSCGAVVRLRTDRRRRRRFPVLTAVAVPPPLVEPPPAEIDVELVAPPAPANKRPSQTRQRAQLVIAAIVAGMVLLAIAGGVALWLLH